MTKSAHLVTFTEEIPNGKLHFLGSDIKMLIYIYIYIYYRETIKARYHYDLRQMTKI